MMTYSITHQPFDIFISNVEKRLWSLWSVCYMYINDEQSLDGWCYTLQIHVLLKWSVLGWVTLHVTDTSEMMLMISPWMGDATRYRYVWDDVDDQSLDGWHYTLQICLRWCWWSVLGWVTLHVTDMSEMMWVIRWIVAISINQVFNIHWDYITKSL